MRLGLGLESTKPPCDFDFDEDLQEGESVFPALVLLSDQEQKQLCGIYYLQRHLKLAIEHIGGPMHRLNNDITRGLVLAGSYDVCMMCMMIQNLADGPFRKSGSFALMQEVGLDVISHCDCEDPILVRLWPLICKDHKWTSSAQTDAAARRRFLADIMSSPSFSVKGPKGAPSRGCSILNGMRCWLPEFHTKLLGLVFYCVQRGLATSREELFQPSLSVAPQAAQGAQHRGASSSSSSSRPQAPASGGDPELVASASAGRAAERDKTQGLLRKAANTVQAVTRMMADPDWHSRVVLVELATSAFHDHYSLFASTVKGAESVLDYFSKMAVGDCADTVIGTLESLANLERLGLAGFVVSFPASMRGPWGNSPTLVQTQDALAAMMFRIAAHLISERALSMMHCSSSYPCLWAGALHPLESKGEEALRRMKAQWEAFDVGMKSPLPSVKRMASRLPLNTRAMADTARIARRSDWRLDVHLRSRLTQMFDGFGNEKLLEDTLGKVRDSELRGSCKNTMSLWRAYEIPSATSMLAPYDRQEVEVDPCLPMPTAAGDGHSFFHPPASLNHDLNFKGVVENQVWDTFSSITLRQTGADLHLLTECRASGRWSEADDAWHAALVPKHTMVLCRQVGKPVEVFFVLAAMETAILVWPVQRVKGEYCKLMAAGGSAKWLTVMSLTSLEVIPYSPVSPLTCFLQSGIPQASYGIVFKIGSPHPLLDYLADHGFAGIAEVHLKKLFLELDLPILEATGESTSELLLATDLVLHVKPDIDEAALKTALLMWTADKHLGCNSTLSQVATMEVLEDLCAAGDLVMEHAHSLESDVAARQKMLQQVQAVTAKKFASNKSKKPKVAKAAKPAAKQLTGKAANRWWCNVRGDAEFIEHHRPPADSLHVDHDCGRYLLAYGQVRKSISWTRRGMADASVDALRWWWSQHTAATGEACPWPFAEDIGG